MPAALKELGLALARLFPARKGPDWFILLSALVLQILWWQMGRPYAHSLPDAVMAVAWTVVLLFLVPLLLARIGRIDLADSGFGPGDARFGGNILLFGAPIVVLLAWFATADPVFQAEYPWPGTVIAASPVLLLGWSVTYAGYYLAYEFFYRGFLQGALARRWGIVPAIWLQTVASALIHLGKPFPELIASIPAGLVFGVIAHRSRSVLWPFLLHLLLGIATDMFSLLRQGAL